MQEMVGNPVPGQLVSGVCDSRPEAGALMQVVSSLTHSDLPDSDCVTGNLPGSAVGIDHAFIMQMLIPAFEARGCTFDPATGQGTDLDIRRCKRQSHRVAVASNDNEQGVWHGVAFRFAGWEIAA